MQISADWIAKVSFLSKILARCRGSDDTASVCEEFVIEFCSMLHSAVHSKGEFFGKPHALYILVVGLVGREGRVRRTGSVWGEDQSVPMGTY